MDVRVVYTKWDGGLHWHFRLTRLGQDRHGVWLACPIGTRLQRGDEPPRAEPAGFVFLVPTSGSWTANWNLDSENEVYADVTTPPVWTSDGEVTAVDLDLDVVRRHDGTVALLDEDEFADHRARYGYPDEVVASAWATAGWLLDAVARRVEPFGDDGPRWLDVLR